MPISISNQQTKYNLSPKMETIIKEITSGAMEKEGYTTVGEVTIVLVDDQMIQELNRDYRGIDSPTDVLAFSYIEDNPDEPDHAVPAEELDSLGDIIVSMEQVHKQAKEYGHSAERELGFLVAHGIYHLMGYDHQTPEDETIMEAKVEAMLNFLNLPR